MNKLSYTDIMKSVDNVKGYKCLDLKWRIKASYDFEVNKANGRLQFVRIPSYGSPYVFGFSDLEEENTLVYVYIVENKLAFVAIDDGTYKILDCSVIELSRLFSLVTEFRFTAGIMPNILNAFLQSLVVCKDDRYIRRLPTTYELAKGALDGNEDLGDHIR